MRGWAVSREQAVRSLRALDVIEAKATHHAEEWGEVDDCVRQGFEKLAEVARALGAEIEEVYPGRKKSGLAKPHASLAPHDNQQELPLE